MRSLSALRIFSACSNLNISRRTWPDMLHLPFRRYWFSASVSPAVPLENKKGHRGCDPVSFFDAYGVSCRARAEEAHPTAHKADSPQGMGSPPQGVGNTPCIRRARSGYARELYHRPTTLSNRWGPMAGQSLGTMFVQVAHQFRWKFLIGCEKCSHHCFSTSQLLNCAIVPPSAGACVRMDSSPASPLAGPGLPVPSIQLFN
jgi:hypothetical protein